ncbi:hypothetical protein D3C77_392840 [compost metagenome]
MRSTTADICGKALHVFAVKLRRIRWRQVFCYHDDLLADLCRIDVIQSEQMGQHTLRYVFHIGSSFAKIGALHIFEHGDELLCRFIQRILRADFLRIDFIPYRRKQLWVIQNKQMRFENLCLLLP